MNKQTDGYRWVIDKEDLKILQRRKVLNSIYIETSYNEDE